MQFDFFNKLKILSRQKLAEKRRELMTMRFKKFDMGIWKSRVEPRDIKKS